MTTSVAVKEKIKVLIKLYETCLEHHDLENAKKLKQLILKIYDQKLFLSFVGHFSAGKSTMINTLLQEQILPTSPIPTSANVVMLEKGNDEVTLLTKAGEWHQLEGEYDVAQIKQFCTQGADIEKIHIRKNYERLNEDIVIIDTPGIDSTEAAHRLATESMLHLADVIFYVTDYNHVQSEENISFIQQMKKQNKTIFLIVNQIDKHRDDELLFSTFKKQINESFISVGLKETDIFYTTLVDENNPHNEIERLKKCIHTLVEQKDELIMNHMNDSQNEMIHDHLQKYKEELEISNEDEVLIELEKRNEEKEHIVSQIEEEERKQKQVVLEIENKIKSILKNANLTPFETREKAGQFIEANEPHFKVGFLFSKKKTEEERMKRTNSLYESLQKNVETELTWHIINTFKALLKQYELDKHELYDEVQAYAVPFSKEFLFDILKRGASFNNQYVLTYSADMSDEVKKIARKKAYIVIEQIIAELKKKNETVISQLNDHLQVLTKEIFHYNDQLERFKAYQYYEKTIQQMLDSFYNEKINIEEWITANKVKELKIDYLPNKVSHHEQPMRNIEIAEKELMETDTAKPFLLKVKAIVQQFQEINGFHSYYESLIQKIERYENRSFTVALFGAFSSGKSSFANALLGEKILPSSPTPTTAAINKISPVTAHKHHGFVEVKLKDEKAFLHEMKEKLESLSIENDTITNVLAKLRMKNDASSLLAIMEDYAALSKNGLVREEHIQSFADFVAKEEKACMVEEVTIYYDCPITRLGITLVDTPGAHSFNQRHTNLAFQYIKNADAIIYLTYFNHPFTKGDQEFLRQLGRVKDSFSLDKMFFIINAIDLAKDEEEMNVVKHYINEQLFQHEIRTSRLYGISSLNVLEKNDSIVGDFSLFKQQFLYFIENELMNTTIFSMKEELARADEQIEWIIQHAKKDEAEKEEEQKRLSREKTMIEKEISDITNGRMITELTQEVEELFFYIKQRLNFRFSDFFKEAFHPGIIQNGKRIDESLKSCLIDLVQRVEFELLQELQATTLRIENHMRARLDDEFIRMNRLLMKYTDMLKLRKMDVSPIETPNIQITVSGEHIEHLTESLKFFRNPKVFFEKNEKKKMQDDLMMRMDIPITTALQYYEEIFIKYYVDILIDLHKQYIIFIGTQVNDTFEAVFQSFELKQNMDCLQNIKKEIQSTIELV